MLTNRRSSFYNLTIVHVTLRECISASIDIYQDFVGVWLDWYLNTYCCCVYVTQMNIHEAIQTAHTHWPTFILIFATYCDIICLQDSVIDIICLKFVVTLKIYKIVNTLAPRYNVPHCNVNRI